MNAKLVTVRMALTDLVQDRREKGQGTLEYVAMVVVAAIIVLAVVTYLSGVDLGGILSAAVDNVLGALGG